MDSLRLDLVHKGPEARDEESPTGWVTIERGESRAVLASACAAALALRQSELMLTASKD